MCYFGMNNVSAIGEWKVEQVTEYKAVRINKKLARKKFTLDEKDELEFLVFLDRVERIHDRARISASR